MQEEQHEIDFRSAGRRKRTLWTVVAHLLVVAAFFVATFFMGNPA